MVDSRLMLRRAGSLVALGALGWACSPTPVAVVAPAPVAPPKPPPERARWVFPSPDGAVSARLDLGDGSTLYLSTDGRRERARGNGPLVDAPTLALTDLLGVVRDDKGRFVFVGASGEVFKADEPLGPLTAPTPQVIKLSKDNWWTAGHAAFVGIDPADGHVVRSGDYGATWQTVQYPGASKYGKAYAVELDPQGNGLMLRFPQEAFVSHDDGATWASIPTPGIGARSVLRDGADHLFLQGRNSGFETPRARLDGSTLTVTNETPVRLLPNAQAVEAKCGGGAAGPNHRTLLAGDHVVELTEWKQDGKTGITVASGPIALGPGTAKLHEELGTAPFSNQVAGYGPDVVYLGHDETDASKARTSVFRSADFGTTWHKETTLEGVDVSDGGELDVAVGPGGFTFVTTLCAHATPEGRVCAHRQVRPAGSDAFEDMVFDEEMSPHAFAFDEKHDRVYVVGLHADVFRVYESPLTKNHFVRMPGFEAYQGHTTDLSVDDDGVLRVFAYDSAKHAWEVHTRTFPGAESTTWLAVNDGAIAFAGARGLIFDRNGNGGWETDDGGASWIPTATNGSVNGLSCSSAGCLEGDARRVGWDLPAVQDERRVTAGDPPKAASGPSLVSAPPPPLTALACKPAGAPSFLSKVAGDEMVDDHAADIRWSSVEWGAASKISVHFGTRSAVRETLLLPALPKATVPRPGEPHTTVRSGAYPLNDGVVAARYHSHVDAHGDITSIDVDLVWWSASTGRTRSHTLAKLAPFYLSPEGQFSGTPQIVDGGVVFQVASHTLRTYFVHDDGTVESLALPNGAGVANAERIGKRWVLADSRSGTVQLSWSNDGGKVWSQKDWGLGVDGNALVVLLDGAPTLTFSEQTATAPSLLFALPTEIPDDPPAPVVIDASAVETPCDAHAGSLRLSTYIAASPYRLSARIGAPGDPKSAVEVGSYMRVTHVAASGKICTSAYTMRGYDSKKNDWHTAFLYPEATGWHGWWFRPNEGSKNPEKATVAEPITCEVDATRAH